MKPLIFTLSLIFIISSCNSKKLLTGFGAKNTKTSEAIVHQSNDERPTDTSEGIPGYNIRCGNRTTESADKKSVGCKLVDDKDQKANLQQISKGWQWRLTGNQQQITIDTFEAPQEDDWHVHFNLQGDAGQLNQFVKSLKVHLDITGNEDEYYEEEYDYGYDYEIEVEHEEHVSRADEVGAELEKFLIAVSRGEIIADSFLREIGEYPTVETIVLEILDLLAVSDTLSDQYIILRNELYSELRELTDRELNDIYGAMFDNDAKEEVIESPEL